MQAIALSLQDSGPSGSTDMVNANGNETKGKMQAKEDTCNKKRKKSVSFLGIFVSPCFT